MSIGLLTIKTSAAGEDWVNTWGVSAGGIDEERLTDEDMDELIGAGVDLAINGVSLPGDPAFAGTTSLLAAVIAFHRTVTFQGANVTGLYLSDGKDDKLVPGANRYLSLALNLPCLRVGAGDGSAVIPLSITWLINRNPLGRSQRPGRLYLRFALVDGETRPGTKDGVDWTDASTAAAAVARLESAVTTSGMSNYFLTSGIPATPYLGLPTYAREETANAGDLVSMTPLRGLVSHNPVSRQLTRGRRKKAAV